MSHGWNDKERDRERRRVLRALLLSLLLHLALILAFVVVASLGPSELPETPEDDQPVEVTILPPPEPQPQSTPYLATTESQRSDRAPDTPAFESDKDTLAASEHPATGNAPLPTQSGEEAPAMQFENREYTPGKQPREAAPSSPSQPQPPAPSSTPAPEKPLPTPKPQTGEIALLQADKPRPTPQKRQDTPPKPPTPARPPSAPGYQPQTRVTRLRGNISNRGRSSAAAVATPLGRYKKQISDAIGSRWYFYVNDALSLLQPGTVDIRFSVQPSGKTSRVEVLRNSSNESFASTSVRAVMEAEIPPIPDDILPMLEGGRIEVDYSFTILSN